MEKVQLTNSELKDLVRRSDNYAIGALLALCPTDTNEEGFQSYSDSKILNEVADFYLKKGYLTEKQVAMIRPKLEKYMDRIIKKGFTPADPGDQFSFNIKGMFKKQKTTKDAIKVDDETIKLKFPYNAELVAKIKNINGRKFIPGEKSWTIPLTLVNVDKILEWEFQLDENLSQWYNEINQDIKEIAVPKMNDILKPFQKKGVSFIESKNGRALIADSMGLGKTLQAIAWLQLNREKDVFPALIVVPAAVKENWKREFEKFTDFGKTVETVYGTKPYKTKGKIIVINFDILKDWYENIKTDIRPNTIIVDEIHKIKGKQNPGKKKEQEVKRVAVMLKLAKQVKYFIGLTGTPILNKPIELYNPLKMIKPTLFPNRHAFAYKYCDAKKTQFGTDYSGAKNTRELHEILVREIMIRRKKEDVLKDMKGKVRSITPLEIDNRKEYKRAYTDLINYLREIDVNRAVKAQRAKTLAKINTLKQLAVKGKLAQATNWVEDMIENEKLVLFVYHTNTAKMFMEKFGNQAVQYVGGMTKKQRQQAQDKFWKDDNIRLFVGNIEAAGTGINLQCASHVAFLEFPWSPGLYSQCEDRLDRIGQKNLVNVWNLIAQNSIEENIIVKLENKAKVISAVVDGEDGDDTGIFNELIHEFYDELKDKKLVN